MNKEIWKMTESEIVETHLVFKKDFDKLTKKINRYWYNLKAEKQSDNIIKQVIQYLLKNKKYNV